jgi:hypothetical protein
MSFTKIPWIAVDPKDKERYLSILEGLCKPYGINFSIMAAICEHESSWDTYAIKFEPRFKYIETPGKYVHINNDLDTEKNLQMCSWGIGQIMGATARTLGFNDSLLKLLKPEIGLEYACKYFNKVCNPYPTDDKKIAAYNRGSIAYTKDGKFVNQNYVDAVNLIIKKYRNQN